MPRNLPLVAAVVVLALTMGLAAVQGATPQAGLGDQAAGTYSAKAAQGTEEAVASGIYINEVMADNDAAVPGPNGTYPDWIELYNAGPEAVDLSGMYLTDDPGNPVKWQFPNGTIISGRGYLVVWSNGYAGEEALHVSFALNANGETLTLFGGDGATLIDQVTLRKQLRDVSFGRAPDGSANWDYFSTSTPASANIESPLPAPPDWPGVLLAASAIAIVATVVFLRGRGRRQ